MKNPIENVQLKKEPSLEEKEIIKSFESIPFKERRHYVDFLLVWRKCKSATDIYIDPNISDMDLEKIKKIIKDAGLYFKDMGLMEDKMHSNEKRRICFVANNEKDLEAFSTLWFGDHENDPNVYKELGRMSGFPQTAIDVYDKIDKSIKKGVLVSLIDSPLILTPSEKKKMIPFDLYVFSLFFYMSKEHWKDELKTVQNWAENIKITAPNLYRSLLTRDLNMNWRQS